MLISIYTYISIKLSKVLEEILFQIAALHIYSEKYEKLITLPSDNLFINESKIFSNNPMYDYITVTDEDAKHKIIPYNQNIMLDGKFIDFKPMSEVTLNYMRNFIYSNEDYMYQAYEKYTELRTKFGIDDDEMVSIYFEDTNTVDKRTKSYYKKALILMNKQNIVVFSENAEILNDIFDDDHNVLAVWDDNIYVRFILLSFFKYNILQYYKPYYSMWAAYISKYQDLKTVVLPDYLKRITNTKINNMHCLYVD